MSRMAMPPAPLARYDPRYARAIGKWMLNAANAARLFYPGELPKDHQRGRHGIIGIKKGRLSANRCVKNRGERMSMTYRIAGMQYAELTN